MWVFLDMALAENSRKAIRVGRNVGFRIKILKMKILLKITMAISAVVLSCNFANSQNVITLKNGEKIYFSSIDTTGDYIEYKLNLLSKKEKISKFDVLSLNYNGTTTEYTQPQILPEPKGNIIALDYSERGAFSIKNQGECMKIFAEYSEAAYFKYKRGVDVLHKGRDCMIAAGAVLVGGIIAIPVSRSIKSKEAAIVAKSVTYGIFIGVPVLISVGIPLVCVGKARIRKSFELYNIDYNKAHAQNGLSLNLGYTGTGLSLALNF